MREIKFRAWYNDEMKYGIERHHVEHHSMSGWSGDVWDFKDWLKNSEVMQFTGHLDKNNKEIYEGDILEREAEQFNQIHGIDLRFLIVVDFYEGSFNSPYTYRRVGKSKSEVVGRAYGKRDFKEYKVIGNIYENPDLIKTEV
jgi:uncharacterized phage protein (TIGR01671 family)